MFERNPIIAFQMTNNNELTTILREEYAKLTVRKKLVAQRTSADVWRDK